MDTACSAACTCCWISAARWSPGCTVRSACVRQRGALPEQVCASRPDLGAQVGKNLSSPCGTGASRCWSGDLLRVREDLLGSDQYQVMTRQAMLRFWTLTARLFCFLEAQRAAAHEATLTCGDVRRRLQQEHQRNLLQWLAEALQEGRSVDQICSQLAIEPGKVQG